MALDQDLAMAAANSGLIVVIAARMAQGGVTSQHPIAQYALVASTPRQMPHSALAMATLSMIPSAAQVAVANGVTIAAIVAMMVRAGVISQAPIVELVQDGLMAALHRQGVGEIDVLSSFSAACFSLREVFLHASRVLAKQGTVHEVDRLTTWLSHREVFLHVAQTCTGLIM